MIFAVLLLLFCAVLIVVGVVQLCVRVLDWRVSQASAQQRLFSIAFQSALEYGRAGRLDVLAWSKRSRSEPDSWITDPVCRAGWDEAA